MKLLVCGGRDFDDVEFIVTHLTRLHTFRPVAKLIHGACRGADTIAGLWAEEMEVPIRSCPADWKIHGRKAGMIRNQQMLDEERPDVVFAFPGGNGTADMVTRSLKSVHEVFVSNWIFFKKEDPKSWFLSNFAEGFGFHDSERIWWETTEHYYQAMKTPISLEREYIRTAPTPAAAKCRAEENNRFSDWNKRKVDVMRRALSYKFAPETEAARLLDTTGIDYLVEYAPWGDTFWGVDKNKNGKNVLGKLLMEQRDQNIVKMHRS